MLDIATFDQLLTLVLKSFTVHKHALDIISSVWAIESAGATEEKDIIDPVRVLSCCKNILH